SVGVCLRSAFSWPGATTMDSAERIGMRPVMNEARLAVPAREHRALLGETINVRGRMTEGHAASRITAEIIPAGVVLHQHDDVGFLLRRAGRSDYAEKRGRGYKQRQAIMY